jgi:hypothetical protein
MSEASEAKAQLAGFIAKFTPEVAAVAKAALVKMRKRYPTALELVYDNYNALGIGFSPTERASDVIFSIVAYPRWVTLFLLQARSMPDPLKILKGNGKVVRHIVLTSAAMLDEPAVRDLMLEAEVRAKVRFDPRAKRKLIIKAVSAKQRPRRP